MTVKDIINTALYDIGVVPPGSEPSNDFHNLALLELNSLLNIFSVEGLMFHSLTTDTITLTASKASYTISDVGGSELDIERPVKIHSAYIREDSQDYNIEVFNSLNEYDQYQLKTSEGIPDKLFYKALSPAGTLYFYPAPDKAYSCYLTSEKQLSSMITQPNDVVLPDEYEFMLSKNLAKALMPKFGRTDPNIIQMADYAKQTIMNNNARIYLQESKFDRLITYRLCQ